MSNYTIEISGDQTYYVEVSNSEVESPISIEVTQDNNHTVEISSNNTFITFETPSGYPLSATSGALSYTRIEGLDDHIQSLSSDSSNISIKIYNNSPYAIQRGQAVYINGFNTQLNIPTASTYIADGTISEQLFCGLISEYTPSGDYGFVNNFGVLSNLNTTGNTSNISEGSQSWSIGDVLYSSSSDYGKLTNSKPTKNIILVGIVTNVHATSGSILVRSSISPQFSQLNGINFNGLSDSNIIRYNSSTSQWSNYTDLDGGIV